MAGELITRVPPQSLDAEAAVISAVLLAPSCFAEVLAILAPEHFYADANRRVFEAMVAVEAKDVALDVVQVAEELRNKSHLDQIGGTPYLVQLADATPAVANVLEHARIVREKWRQRQFIATCQRAAADAYELGDDAQEFFERTERAIFDLARVPERTTVRPISHAIKKAFQMLAESERRGTGITGASTGFGRLDHLIAGLHDGDLYVVAARPGMGKTAFVLEMAVSVARSEDAGVLFCTLEMPEEQIAGRLLASHAGVDVGAIRRGQVREHWRALTDAGADLARLPLFVDDTAALSLPELRGKARALQSELKSQGKRLSLVVVDYLQLMQGSSSARNREQEISELSRGLKRLAKELKVPVLALSQLNRAVESRPMKDRRPQLADLRESGAIEQDADTIIFIYRDDYYFKETEHKGVAEIIVAKQRNGPTGTVLTKFTAAYTRFDNLESWFDESGQQLTLHEIERAQDFESNGGNHGRNDNE